MNVKQDPTENKQQVENITIQHTRILLMEVMFVYSSKQTIFCDVTWFLNDTNACASSFHRNVLKYLTSLILIKR